MKTRIMIALFITSFAVIPVFSQKIDNLGRKMVSEIVHESYNNWGECYDQVTFKFNYNQKGDMIKIIVHRRTSIGDIFKQNKKSFLAATLSINGNTMLYDEYESGEKIGYRKHRFTLSSDGKRLLNDVVTTSDGKHVTTTYEYENNVFTGITQHYRGDFETWHLIFNKIDGNYYPVGKEGFVYSDEVNDTNINLDCLTWRIFGPIMVNEQEHLLLTPQVPLRSKNIIKEFVPDRPSGKMMCEVERNEKGNIVLITTRYADNEMAKKCLKISYLY